MTTQRYYAKIESEDGGIAIRRLSVHTEGTLPVVTFYADVYLKDAKVEFGASSELSELVNQGKEIIDEFPGARLVHKPVRVSMGQQLSRSVVRKGIMFAVRRIVSASRDKQVSKWTLAQVMGPERAAATVGARIDRMLDEAAKKWPTEIVP